MNDPEVSMIVLNWNGLDDTVECLESVMEMTYPSYKVVVVDNASDGNDVEVLREKFGNQIQVIENEKNCGVGEGFNIGIRYVMENHRPDYILIMNNDLVVAPNCLDELVTAAEDDEKIGVVGPKIYFYDYNGKKDIIWSAGGRVRTWSLKIHTQIGEGDKDSPKYRAKADVDWITGCVMMFRSSLTEEVGLLNPWYFIGHEDIEFCLKARKRGYKIVFVPTAKAWHKVGVSREKANITFADPSAYYYLIRTCFPLPVYVYHLLIMPVLMSRWAVLYLIRYRNIGPLKRFFTDLIGLVYGRKRRGL
ncbi:MAG: glycosyltransferase family 2 protein [Dehalococcoidia bacterium]|nr:glycosyltransferase family 2 protein [Dehalococcoidia bacterium]